MFTQLTNNSTIYIFYNIKNKRKEKEKQSPLRILEFRLYSWIQISEYVATIISSEGVHQPFVYLNKEIRG